MCACSDELELNVISIYTVNNIVASIIVVWLLHQDDKTCSYGVTEALEEKNFWGIFCFVF